MGYLSKTVSSYFPTQVTDVFTQGRDFATAVLPITGYSPICVIATIQRSLKLLVATQNGFLYVYDVSEIEGGDCKLVIKHDLRNIDTQPIKIQEVQSNGSPSNSSPPGGGGPSYASAVKAGTSDDD